MNILLTVFDHKYRTAWYCAFVFIALVINVCRWRTEGIVRMPGFVNSLLWTFIPFANVLFCLFMLLYFLVGRTEHIVVWRQSNSDNSQGKT